MRSGVLEALQRYFASDLIPKVKNAKAAKTLQPIKTSLTKLVVAIASLSDNFLRDAAPLKSRYHVRRG